MIRGTMKIPFHIICMSLAAILLFGSRRCHAYSILTHEAIIDASWEKSILPLLVSKYPGTTSQQIKEAHAYAYGGAIAPDIGYFPFGSILFTDLVHYVRSGDFVNALLDEAQDINEYAFGLGFLCHYMADKYGHSLGTNRCVPMVYPKDKKKYGDIVTYDEDHTSHKRMEFGFDVLQTVKGNYVSQAYHDFIGFRVSRPILERAFSLTYGLDINDIFGDLSLSIETFRWSVMSLFPALTRAAWLIKKKEILQTHPNASSRSFTYTMRKANYYSEFGAKRKKPGVFAAVLSVFIRIVPKIGPMKSLRFKEPGPIAEKLFIQSFDTVLAKYTQALKTFDPGKIRFTNIDFDTGNLTAPGEYTPADKNYDLLLIKLDIAKFKLMNSGLKQNMIDYYADRSALGSTRKAQKQWARTQKALKDLTGADYNH